MARLRPAPLLAGVAASIGALLLIVALILVLAPLDLFRGLVEARLSQRLGVPVTIAHIRRDGLSFVPTVTIEGVRAPQPGWAGGGDLVAVRALSLRLPLLPLLVGRVEPRGLSVDGAQLAIIRRADGVSNWPRGSGGSGATDLEQLGLRDVRIDYRDSRRDRSAQLVLSAGPGGVLVSGAGIVRGTPVRIGFAGAPLRPGPWRFAARIIGATLDAHAAGIADAPLDSRHLTLDLRARADSLKTLDTLTDAGLFGSQPIAVTAHVRYQETRWQIDSLAGTIGSSRIVGHGSVDKVNGRSTIDATIDADHFNFDDLATDAGIAAARAAERRNGRRIIPATKIAMDHLAHTDGVLHVTTRHMHGTGSPPMAAITATIRLDHSLLTVAPLDVALTRGTVRGKVTLDQRGRPQPLLGLDLSLAGTTLTTLVGDEPIDGVVTGRVRLAGTGETIRSAIGRSSGTIGLVARDGTLPARLASLLGFDIGRGLTTASGDVSQLRCGALRLAVTNGRGRVERMLVDTSRAQTSGQGSVDLADEGLALRLTGAPKRDSLLRLPGSVTIGGTVADPQLTLPPATKSAGTILKAIGRALSGKQGPTAGDADCAALARATLR